MTTTWKITQLDRQTSDGFITTAHWTCTAVDGDYTASAYSTCGFEAATPAIPYASVTEAEVLVVRSEPMSSKRFDTGNGAVAT